MDNIFLPSVRLTLTKCHAPPDIKMEITREFWYSQVFILFEIIKQTRNKEIAIIEKNDGTITDRKTRVVRCINASTIDYLKKNFEAFRFMQFPLFNLYFSLASYDRMPQFSFSPVERAKQYALWTAGQYREKIVAYKNERLIHERQVLRLKNMHIRMNKDIT